MNGAKYTSALYKSPSEGAMKKPIQQAPLYQQVPMTSQEEMSNQFTQAFGKPYQFGSQPNFQDMADQMQRQPGQQMEPGYFGQGGNNAPEQSMQDRAAMAAQLVAGMQMQRQPGQMPQGIQMQQPAPQPQMPQQMPPRMPQSMGLQRLSPGVYRNTAGELVGSRGQALPRRMR